LFGRKEVFKSLRTSDYEEAKRSCLTVEAELKNVFAALDKKVRTPDPSMVARDYQRNALADDLAWRLTSPPSDREDEALSYHLTDRLEALVDDPTAINLLLDRVLVDQGCMSLPPSARSSSANCSSQSRRHCVCSSPVQKERWRTLDRQSQN
jgi:hypothetical protein